MKRVLIAVLVFGGMSCAVESGPDPAPVDEPTVSEPATTQQNEGLTLKPEFFRCLEPQTCSCGGGVDALTGGPASVGAQCGVNKFCC